MGGGNAKPSPLPDRVMDVAFVAADHVSLAVYEITLGVFRAAEAFHEADVVAVRHEANVLAVAFVGIGEGIFLSDPAHLFLPERTERKTGVFELFLCHRIKYVTLVFRGVKALFQKHTAVLEVFLDPGVVSCDDTVAFKLFHLLLKQSELENAVAFDAGVGRPSLFVGAHERLDERVAELLFVVKDIVRDPQSQRDKSGISRVFLRAARRVEILSDHFIVIQAHGASDALISRLFHKKRGHRRVHASAHCNQSFHPYEPSTRPAGSLVPKMFTCFGSIPYKKCTFRDPLCQVCAACSASMAMCIRSGFISAASACTPRCGKGSRRRRSSRGSR